MKLGTHVPRNNTHVCTKSHNFGLKNYSVMPLFGHRNSYKMFSFAHNSNTVPTFSRKRGTHIFNKSHKSGINNVSVMPLFRLKNPQTSVGVLLFV